MISYPCAGCGTLLRAPDGAAGKTASCPRCGTRSPVPAQAAAPAAAASRARAATLPGPGATVDYRPPDGPPQAAPTERGTLRDGAAEPDRPSAGPALPTVPGYEVLEEIGRGGMGVVYKARQVRPRRLVALKMVLGAEHAGPDAAARFRAEAEAVARLQHPNIVQIHEVGEHRGHTYLTLEYAEAGSLAQRLAGGRLPARRAAGLVECLARAVHYAHGKGVVHRDLKPANVLLAGAADAPLADCTPKIADFGLAKQVGDAAPVGPRTQTGAILGTPAYMAPEQAGGKARDVGPATDVYALGAVLYECLTGRAPFEAETTLELILQVATQPPAPPRRHRPELARDLETVCLKCLEKEPGRRYGSALELADDLRAFLDGRPVKARRAGALERFGRWVRRRKELAYLAAGALAAVCVGLLALGLWDRFAAKPAAPAGAPDQAGLPDDLRFIPASAPGFVALRVGDLWGLEAWKDVPPDLKEAAGLPAEWADPEKLGKLLEEQTSIHPRDVERLSLTMLEFPDAALLGQERFDPSFLAVLRLSRPCSPDLVRGALGRFARLEATDYKGRTLYAGKVKGPDLDVALCFVSDRLILASNGEKAMRQFLDRRDAGATDGPLLRSLEAAARGHHLVVGLPAQQSLLDQSLGPPEPVALAANLRAVLAARALTLTADFRSSGKGPDRVDGLHAELRGHYADAQAAARARRAADALLAEAVAAADAAGPGPLPRSLVDRALAPLRGGPKGDAPCRQEDSDVVLVYDVEWKARDAADLVRQAAARSLSANKLRQIGVALHEHEIVRGHLPPPALTDAAGKPLLSWRVTLLPHLGQGELYKQFRLDEPWDSEHNKKLLEKMPAVYAAPTEGAGEAGTTRYRAVVGPGAGFEAGKGLRFTDFTNGVGNTIVVVEAKEAVPWTRPEELAYAPDRPLPAFGGVLPDGFHALMGDGYVRFFRADTAEAELRRLLRRSPPENQPKGPQDGGKVSKPPR
jgi:hypothetical protein